MVKPDEITEEQLDAEERHDELVATLLKLIPAQVDLSKIEAFLKVLCEKEVAETDNKELLAAIDGLRKAIESRPRSFQVERGKMGFIERIVAE